MNLMENGFLSIEQVSGRYLRPTDKAKRFLPEQTDGKSFQEILEEQTQVNLTFSKHAVVRLQNRNIELSTGQMQRLADATTEAGRKGIKDSLVLVDQLAFIVNVPSKTVVTAMAVPEDQVSPQNIFTNIDGAVIA
ncbi:MAG: flagellar protein [Lachnospiraceae bacterium]|jgi:flagellar operon protein|nr:flagellar protein [Lachnospiraceae bacterium]